MAKNLTLTQLNKLSKVYDETKTVYLDDKNELKIDIHPNFKPTEVNEVVSSFVDLFGDEKIKDIQISDKIFFLLLDAHAVVHFSNLNIKMDDKLKYVNALIALIDLPNNGFDKILKACPNENWADLIEKYQIYFNTMSQIVQTVEKLNKDKEQNKSSEPVNVLSNEKTLEVVGES